MEELQMEILMERGQETPIFITSFINPGNITIEDKLQFENFFDAGRVYPMKDSDPVY